MRNYIWRDTVLQATDLPIKAQKFIQVMNLDISELEFLLLEADPNGGYFKNFESEKLAGIYSRNFSGVYSRLENRIYFIGRIGVGTSIHELTHFFLYNTNYDTKAIGEAFISQYGKDALSNYGCISEIEGKWDEVVCEIVATYGRRGQFDKIKELFNQGEQGAKTP